MPVHIAALEYYLPPKVVANADFNECFSEWDEAKIFSKTGIASRHVAADDVTALDLAEAACRKLFLDGSAQPSEIDYLLFCTQSPDYVLPGNCTQLQARLGLSQSLGCIDYSHGCSGYVYGLSLAAALAAAGQARSILLITSETYSKYLAQGDRTTRTIFGDAATATVLRATEENVGPHAFVFGTDGRGAGNLVVPESGAKSALVKAGNLHPEAIADGLREKTNLFMNGPAIFTYALKEVPSLVERVLLKANAQLDDIDSVVFHQANAFMLEHLRIKCKIPVEKCIVEIEDVGNTVSSTIPIALKRSLDDGRIKPGDLALLAGFGVGYSSAACLLRL